MTRLLPISLVLAAGTLIGATSLAQSQPATSQPPPGVDPATHAAHIAQGTAAHAQPPSQPTDTADLARQLAELRAQIAQLQAALAQGQASGGPKRPMPAGMGMRAAKPTGPGMGTPGIGAGEMPQPNGAAPMPGMASGGGGGGMGMMDMDNMMMGGMGGGGSGGGGMAGGGGSGSMPGMGMMDKMMSMGMSRMGGMGSGSATSTLPGFPGASHIYHIGATGFFLDHGSHISLTVDQQRQLGEIKEQSLLNQSTLQRKIDQAEQDLWDLTGSDAPDAAKIEAKAREIEQARTEQRIVFIRDVGKAAAVLTDDQRKQLTGLMPADPAPANQPGAMPGMGGGGGMSDM